MYTRNMNTRITFFKNVGGQNEDGEVIKPQRKNILTCWAEVSKSTIKEFRQSYKSNQADMSLNELNEVFLIRYQLLGKIDNTMLIDFNGMEYTIIKIEPDHARKEHILIGAKAVR